MLYELVAIVRAGGVNEVKDIARTAGQTVLRHKGVVRKYEVWGKLFLPQKIRKLQKVHHMGIHFIMTFHASAAGQNEVLSVLRLDPRMLRSTIIKNGETLDEVLAVDSSDFRRPGPPGASTSSTSIFG